MALRHSAEAIASAQATRDFTGWSLDNYANDREWGGVGLVNLSHHRDSEALERANFDSALRDLREKYGKSSVDVVSFGHWAVGWVEIAVYDYTIEGLESAVAELHKSLQNYPVLDENLWAEYEWADNHPEGDNTCWADEDENCPCDLPKWFNA